jgi:surface protein
MATLTASAKLTNAFRVRVVDKNVSANLTATFTIGHLTTYNFDPLVMDLPVLSGALARRTRRTYSDLESTSSLANTMRYATKGGKGEFAVSSSLVCEFPTYIEIDIEALMLQGLPEGTDCVLNFQEGWQLEDRGRLLPSGAFEYGSNTQNAPSPEFPSFVTFRTPKFFRSAFSSVFSIPTRTALRIKQLNSTLSSPASLIAYPIFNPGKLAALFGGVFLTVPNAVKKVSAGATLYNSFGPLDVGGTPRLLTALRIKQLASIFDTGVATLTSDAIKYKTPGPVTISSTATISASVDRNIGPIIAIVSSSGTMTTTAIKVARSTPAITAMASLSASAIVTKGLIQNLTAVSSLSVNVSIPMVLETTGSSINLPILYGSVNCVINWGDGTETIVTSPNANWITKNYSAPYGLGVTKQIRIAGYIQHYGYQTQANMTSGSTGYNDPSDGSVVSAGIRNKTYFLQSQTITKIVSFGDLGTESFVGAFINARYLTSVPTRLPSTVTNISRMFWHSIADDQFQNISNIGSWNVSNVTQMEGVFIRNRNGFNPAIGGWNVSNVTNMRDLFVFCDSGFNPNISSWNTGNVQNFLRTFYNASNFNQNIGSWNTGSATNMTGMFENAFSFNQNLTGWCVTNIPTAPANFANTASMPGYQWPVWGTCP